MTDEDKKPYYELYAADFKKYNNQKAELKEKGYFTMPDGSKSTDQYVHPKKKYGDPKKKYGEDCVVPKQT